MKGEADGVAEGEGTGDSEAEGDSVGSRVLPTEPRGDSDTGGRQASGGSEKAG